MNTGAVNMVAVPMDLHGTPVEIGFQLFDHLLQRVLSAASHTLPAAAVAEIYAGLLISTSADMALRFDQALAVDQLHRIADELAKHVGARTPSTTH